GSKMLVCFISFSLNTDNKIGSEGAIKISEALKSNSSLTSLDLYGNTSYFIPFSLFPDSDIDNEAAFKLSEALKSNSPLTSLYLGINRLIASFHSHSKQVMRLAMKELTNYLKHSNQIHLSLFSISRVPD